ncbi:MAG: NAD-dependent epimerase/dehydratase family protein [Candidatus Adlerbacteria bacterium]|nr:NAD-dependent epimerase/dehydratase family protein [Candidatus Adlerbacteria bacterium]
MKHTLLITGAAGYVGTMLVQQFAQRGDVEKIIGIDKEPLPEIISGESKLVYIQSNLSDVGWEEQVVAYKPDIVIHSAWQIREMYGEKEKQWQWNVDGSDRVFDFCFEHSFVTRLVHFSTVASYGAEKTNSVDHRYKEEEGFRKSDYLYAEEKRIVEQHLEEKFEAAKERGRNIEVAIVRPAAITGPRGRYMRIRFGLQAALSGQLKQSFVHKLISLMVSFVPATHTWLRQFIHEDDVVRIVELLAFSPLKKQYDAFNICPPGDVVRAPDMAKAVGKKVIYVHPQLIRFVFFWMWHGTRGRVPTSKGGWKSYSYPIAVSGEKLTREYGFEYSAPSLDAFYYTNGKYENFVPAENRRHK